MISLIHLSASTLAQAAQLPGNDLVPGRACGTCTLCCKVAADDAQRGYAGMG
jgi:hypothetical protein